MGTAAVIPNWNGRRWLPRCLASLEAQTAPFEQIVVVDNGSTDGSLDFLAAEHPGVTVIALEENTGFAHAANRGIETARAGAVALVNTDVELEARWHERLRPALDAAERVASV